MIIKSQYIICVHNGKSYERELFKDNEKYNKVYIDKLE